ncbi:MAG: CBS domain-containing protein [Caldilineae bacterium]|nr:MAG: CBS domain-containing protein [Caldilineae bacterium]
MAERVKEVMSTNIHCCSVEATIPEVAHIMVTHDVSAVIVLDADDYLAGIISRTDLVELRGFDEYWHGLTARHVMKTDVITCAADLPLREASQMLVQHKIHRLVVVEPGGKEGALRPVGVLSQTDIVRDMAASVTK